MLVARYYYEERVFPTFSRVCMYVYVCVYVCMYVCVTAIIRLRLVSKGQERIVSTQQFSAVIGGPTGVMVGPLNGSCIDR